MAGMAWIKAHPTVGTPPWSVSLGECCVVKIQEGRRKERRKKGGCISLGREMIPKEMIFTLLVHNNYTP
jgi:hypothetical protein